MKPPQSDENFVSTAATRAGNFIREPRVIAGGTILASGAILVGGGLALANELSGPTAEQSRIAQEQAPANAEKAAWNKMIDDAETKSYDSSLVIGSPIIVKAGDSNLESHGMERVASDPDYTKDKNDAFNSIQKTSIDIGITQPDQIFDVIGVDLNNDGKKEFLIVKESQIVQQHNGQPLPAPIQGYQLPTVSGDGTN